MKSRAYLCITLVQALAVSSPLFAADVLVEAEGFEKRGGWVVDQQFMDVVGSSYLLAHGLGKPVENARTQRTFAEGGTYHVWVRAKDWVPSHHPGRFRLLINGEALPIELGANGEDWNWEQCGRVAIEKGPVTIELKDLTGFDGRCDAVFFTTDAQSKPPSEPNEEMHAWRRKLLGLPDQPALAGTFDVVVVGGGIAGCSAALTASRLGLTSTLIHDRPTLGGNASPECGIRPFAARHVVVHEVISECNSPLRGPKRPPVPRDPGRKPFAGESNLSLFLGWRAFGVDMDGRRIVAVKARDIRTNEERRLAAPAFIDSTGDGWIGFWAGADYRVGREGYQEFGEHLAPNEADKRTHGNTITFRVRKLEEAVTFPDVPWATAVSRDYANLSSQPDHFWEAGQGKDTLAEAEWTRDHLLRAIYGTMATAKRKYPKAAGKLEFEYVSYILARGESRRLLGDHLLTQNDRGREFHDAVAKGTHFYCLHYTHPDYDFRNIGDSISRQRGADRRPKWETEGRQPIRLPKVEPEDVRPEVRQFMKRAGRGTQIPYRCLYSRNVENLLMAGRDISATHVALMGVKCMGITGAMGVATGTAAALCKRHQTTPRGVYEKHVWELQQIIFGIGEHKDVLKPVRRSGADRRESAQQRENTRR